MNDFSCPFKKLRQHMKISMICGSIVGALFALIEGISIIISPQWGGFRLGARVAPVDFTVLFYSLVSYGIIGFLIGTIQGIVLGMLNRIFIKIFIKLKNELSLFYLYSNISLFCAIYGGYLIHIKFVPLVSKHWALLFTVGVMIIIYMGIVFLLYYIFTHPFLHQWLTLVMRKFIRFKIIIVYVLLIIIISFTPAIMRYFIHVHQERAKQKDSVFVEGSDNRPNIMIILIDALRPDHLSSYGYHKKNSPNIGQIAQEGILYRSVYAQSSWTRPSVASIFTSMYPTSHGIIQLNGDPVHNYILPNEALTISEILNEKGYHTVGFVTNPHITKKFGFDQGFDEFTYFFPQSFYGLQIFKIIAQIFKIAPVKKFYHQASELNKHIYSWLKSDKNCPFFMYIHYTDPHMPYFKHPIQFGLSQNNFRTKWTTQNLLDLYDGEISYVDYHIGKLIELLKKEKLYDNTMIMITSDHGEEFYDHKGYDHGQTLYEEVIKIPLIIKYPNNLDKGKVKDDPVLSIDICPTIMDFLNIPIPDIMKGVSLYKNQQSSETKRVVFAELGEYEKGMRSLQVGRWKLILTQNFPKDSWKRDYPLLQLYEITSDVNETYDLASVKKDVSNDLYNRMKLFIENIQIGSFSSQSSPMDKKLKERLRSLGYID